MSTPQQPQNPTYDQLYKEFNGNELNSRKIFEILYNETVQLKQANMNLSAQIVQLTQEKTQMEKAKTIQEPPKIIEKAKKA